MTIAGNMDALKLHKMCLLLSRREVKLAVWSTVVRVGIEPDVIANIASISDAEGELSEKCSVN